MDQLDQLKAQLKDVETQLSTETAKGANKDAAAVAILEQRQADLLQQIMVQKQAVIAYIATMSLNDLQSLVDAVNAGDPVETDILQAAQSKMAVLEQQQAHEERVTQSISDFDTVVNGLDFGGMTLSQVIGDPSVYQLITIELKQAWMNQASNFSQKIANLTKVNTDKDAKIQDQEKQINDISQQLSQSQLETKYANQVRDNAAAQIEELQQENAQLKQQITSGPQTVKQPTTAEVEAQKKAAMDDFKKQRTIYDVVGDAPINPKNYTAKRACDDSVVTFNWTQKGAYIILNTDAEVQQFRSQYPAEPTTQATDAHTALDQSVQGTTELAPPKLDAQFQDTQTVDTTTTGLANQEQGVQQTGAVTPDQLETRLAQFAQEYGLTKQAVA